eukprot:CAMPEP_0170188262 /NCGR_PEP_ID=MMETSP0040_2-20121228/43915_1 /TAXON_ID=641309 /ORGANISM="Lotharella oceanica, Strain CCMP622" /LENGTH=127 /DNA_ID=CAMNT_0010435519 /DNA_START=443 /DNA_END=822 /DNA_ORIENTATION=-
MRVVVWDAAQEQREGEDGAEVGRRAVVREANASPHLPRVANNRVDRHLHHRQQDREHASEPELPVEHGEGYGSPDEPERQKKEEVHHSRLELVPEKPAQRSLAGAGGVGRAEHDLKLIHPLRIHETA